MTQISPEARERLASHSEAFRLGADAVPSGAALSAIQSALDERGEARRKFDVMFEQEKHVAARLQKTIEEREALRSRVQELEEALRPFAACYLKNWQRDASDDVGIVTYQTDGEDPELLLGDLRAAAKAMEA